MPGGKGPFESRVETWPGESQGEEEGPGAGGSVWEQTPSAEP